METKPHPTRLAQYLDETGVKQRELAEKVGVHESVISKFSTGRAKPKLETAYKIDKATDGMVPMSSWVETDEASDSVGDAA